MLQRTAHKTYSKGNRTNSRNRSSGLRAGSRTTWTGEDSSLRDQASQGLTRMQRMGSSPTRDLAGAGCGVQGFSRSRTPMPNYLWCQRTWPEQSPHNGKLLLRGSWLMQWEEHATFALQVLSSSPTLGVRLLTEINT